MTFPARSTAVVNFREGVIVGQVVVYVLIENTAGVLIFILICGFFIFPASQLNFYHSLGDFLPIHK